MKRLVVCCDGTWQKLSKPYPTNVVKIAQAVKPFADDGVPQIVFYHEGVGTRDEFDELGGGYFGWGIDQNIQDAYQFLCLNYIEGDEIYLFGFSRGAYTVRSLAGLIYCSGLLSRCNIRKAPEAYKLYRDRNIKPSHPEAVDFRNFHGERVPITLLGCWDTVGQLGVPDQIPWLTIDKWINEKYKFHDTVLNPCILNALHAVAIDEQRKVFNLVPMTKSEDNPHQVLRQVWFPGVHTSVGGGNKEMRGLSDGALLWMMEQIKELHLSLELDLAPVEDGIFPDFSIPFDNDLSGIYKMTGEIQRKITGISDDLREFHDSVKQRWQYHYQPPLLPYRPKNVEPYQRALDAWKPETKAAKVTSIEA